VGFGTSRVEFSDSVNQILKLVYDETWHQLCFSFVTESSIGIMKHKYIPINITYSVDMNSFIAL
jgi:hypothetical protein